MFLQNIDTKEAVWRNYLTIASSDGSDAKF